MVKAFGSKNLREHNQYDEDFEDWMEKLPRISFKDEHNLTLRPITPMIMMARHWPKSLATGKSVPPAWCPRFSSETQKFDSEFPCHFHDDFGDRWRAQKVIIFGAIVREWQEEGKRNPVGFIVLPGTTSQALVQAVSINKQDISDPDKGCDLNIINNKNATPAQQWAIQRTDRTKLTDEERAYKLPDLEKVSPDFGDAKFLAEFNTAMKRRMATWSYYVTPKEEGGDGWQGYKKDVNGQPYTAFPELVELVGDGKQKNDQEPQRNASSGKSASSASSTTKRQQLARNYDVLDGNDDGNEDAPPPPPPPKGKKTPPPPPSDDDDEGGDDGDDPSPPPAKKPATKPAPAAKTPELDEDEEETPAPEAKPSADDEEEGDGDDLPFDVEDDELPPPPPPPASKKGKKAGPPEHAAWTADPAGDGSVPAIAWRMYDDGTQKPGCFGTFDRSPKCKKCPVKKDCIAAVSED